MKPLAILITVVSFILVVSASTVLAVDFRCGNTFVEPGISSAEVRYNCGEPKVKEDLGYRGKGVGRKLEKWIYEKGGVYYVLYFEGGELVKIEML